MNNFNTELRSITEDIIRETLTYGYINKTSIHYQLVTIYNKYYGTNPGVINLLNLYEENLLINLEVLLDLNEEINDYTGEDQDHLVALSWDDLQKILTTAGMIGLLDDYNGVTDYRDLTNNILNIGRSLEISEDYDEIATFITMNYPDEEVYKSWQANPPDPNTSRHLDTMDGISIPFDDIFEVVNSQTGESSMMRFPKDPDSDDIGNIANCYCSLNVHYPDGTDTNTGL
ncbi:MAG: hypothetical protein LBB45_03305 [Methanobrevibacter sp.]|jgi:hypothetical protein|nr:hypothetical protein [Candidatus Methanovirga basalitermitum]